jgi:DNA topoisomerase-3
LVGDRDLKSPELTGQWEARLRSIEAGKLAPDQFMQAIAQYTAQIVRPADPVAIDDRRLGSCPRCASEVIQGKRGYGCSAWKAGCKFVLWPTYKDHQLEVGEIRQLLQHGMVKEPIELAGVGRALLTLTESGAVTDIPVPDSGARSSIPKRKSSKRARTRAASGASTGAPSAQTAALGSCPLCGGQVQEQPKSYSCSGWRARCEFVIWKTIAGKKISSSMARTLLARGQTSRLKGFKAKAGKTFAARLKLVDGKVQFDFSQ